MAAELNRNVSGEQTRARLLDVAERLFAELGYDGTSLRALAADAAVNLAAVNYHFETKEALYAEAFARRFREVNVERDKLLEEAAEKWGGGVLPVREVLHAILWPAFCMTQRRPHFRDLLARNLLTPPPFLREVVARENGAIMARFVKEMMRSAPHLSREQTFTRMQFTAGSLLFLVASNDPIKVPFRPLKGSKAYEELLAFATAGMETGGPPL